MVLWAMAFVILVDTALICVLFALNRRTTERYVKLEEWAENWLKRLEQRVEATDMRSKLTEEQLKTMDELLPRDGNGEVLRNRILLQQMNDEMERGLKMEREWNDGVASILNYGKPITEVKTNE